MGFLVALAPLISAIGGLASAGVGIGEAVANSGGSPTPQAPTPMPPNAQQLLQQKALVSQQVPNVDSATSGAASPDYQSMIAQILAGTLGQPGSTAAGAAATGQNVNLANTQPTNATVQGQPVNLSDFLNSFSS